MLYQSARHLNVAAQKEQSQGHGSRVQAVYTSSHTSVSLKTVFRLGIEYRTTGDATRADHQHSPDSELNDEH